MWVQKKNVVQGSYEQVVRWAFGGSGAFTVLLQSPQFLGKTLTSWAKAWVCLIPWLLLWALFSHRVITNKEHRLEICLSGAVLLLAFLNVFCSDNARESYYSIIGFLSSGIIVFWTSLLLVRDEPQRHWFTRLCFLLLAVVVVVDGLFFLAQGGGSPYFVSLFTGNPIPEGTLIILLSLGPLGLMGDAETKWKAVGWLLLLLGFVLILLTERRGTVVAATVMLLAWVFHRQPRWGGVLLAGFLALAVILPFRGWAPFKPLDQNVPSHFNILHRLELYPFAWHVFRGHPLLGIGFRPHNLDSYLAGYQQHNKELANFASTVKEKTTLDNMYLTACVELGSLMTFVYVGLIGTIIVRYLRRIKLKSDLRRDEWVRLLPLVGLMVHSFTYDSLTYPQINWLFHAQLGILAGFQSPWQKGRDLDHFGKKFDDVGNLLKK